MALVTDKDNYLFYKYRVKSFSIIFSDSVMKIDSERINGIYLLEDYLENLYPVFKIDLALEQSVYYKIIKEKKTVSFSLYIQKYYRKNTEDKKSLYSKCIDDVYSLILDDDDENLSEELLKREYPNGEEGEMNAVTTSVELFLFKSSLIRRNTKTVNQVFKNCTVTTALAYLFTKLNLKNVLMTKADNQTVYPTFIIPPLIISQAIRFIDSYYGIHKTGSVIYLGLTKSYVIPFCKSSNAFERGELDTVCIIVPKQGSTLTDNICALEKSDDKTKHYVIADPNSFNPKTKDESGSILKAEDIEVIRADEGSVTSSSDSKSRRKALIVAKGINPYYVDIYKTFSNSGSSEIPIFLRDVDLDSVTPNKKYRFLFEDTKLTRKYKGTYFLCSRSISFIKEGRDLTMGMNCVFRKYQ